MSDAPERLTGALLDRLAHHVSIIAMNGDSYRLKQSTSRRRAAARAEQNQATELVDPDTAETLTPCLEPRGSQVPHLKRADMKTQARPFTVETKRKRRPLQATHPNLGSLEGMDGGKPGRRHRFRKLLKIGRAGVAGGVDQLERHPEFLAPHLECGASAVPEIAVPLRPDCSRADESA